MSANERPAYVLSELEAFSTQLLEKAGLNHERASAVASTLLEADLMGHDTHGLTLLPPYLDELECGDMEATGEPEVVNDSGSAITWDAKYLPGAWITHKAIDLALERIKEHPVVTFAITQSHHIGCLAAYPERATEKGLMMLISCSDPNGKSIAPYGGLSSVYTPNPLAAGIPTTGDPIIFDISMSTTANGVVYRAQREGKKLKHPWLLDGQGNPTDDPNAVKEDPPATILPLGGTDAGYKGYAMGILVEALTSALGGHGRNDHPTRWGSSTFIQIIDPAAFGGTEAFKKEMSFLADQCKSATVRPGDNPVRLPGDRAFALRKEQRENGVKLYKHIMPDLKSHADKYEVQQPTPIES